MRHGVDPRQECRVYDRRVGGRRDAWDWFSNGFATMDHSPVAGRQTLRT